MKATLFASLLFAGLAATAAAQNVPSGPPTPYLGSRSIEPLSPGTIDISLDNALARAMRVNLGLLFDTTTSDTARAARWSALSALMPHIEASLRESTSRVNLRALGVPLTSIPTAVDVDNADARVTLTQSLFDASAAARVRSAHAAEQAAHATLQEGRETVAAVVAGAYLAAVSAEARLELARADARTADALYRLAEDRQRQGLSPEVDTLRAEVERDAREERVIEADNALSKRRIVLLRLIGLDVRQEIRLTSRLGDAATTEPPADVALEQALERRGDYISAREELRGAELAKQAARLRRAPSIGIAANYGALGTEPGSAVATWNAGVVVRVPVFEGGDIRAAVAHAQAVLQQKQAALVDLRGRVAEEIETSRLDLRAAARQVDVSRSAVAYATRALEQSRDRFAAGVTNNIEVIQAQESSARANDQWVSSLYAYNLARVMLARAAGTAEAHVRTLLAPAMGHAR